ncbi:thioredoxin domain-containing protein [Crocosphaera sp. XPORK-15E]|uniref:thioredoxin domain-containing protein n=1 Tax=Crocosphaera sp. XPORK-15E TaxID=3110247 RepID=UPI002B1FC715|nr:thioredoxin domain-containing protein [Crocosphaera sp. XPORK-15E]MEA5533572.1 thioredoxin domain-containing protein [Crocosphaera sp. XPORK-15E]
MPNRLANTQSLYLRKHADNPIDWWYWDKEALESAKAQNKPIFLSIGYSSCHWCTVMEGEAFSDLAIATYLNENFLPIKVDREERPDLDSIYMSSVQMMGIQGGWPLNVFLTPEDLVPFYGGTYFPIEPRYGRPGFLQVLQSIRRFYDTEKEKLQGFKREILKGLQNSAIVPINNTELNDPQLLYHGIDINTQVIQVSSDDFGRPCFPMIPYSNLVLQGTRLPFGDQNQRIELSSQRGQDLALGGIFDHVGGGFHRYTVDCTWTVPHFEKMLYDNGQIVEYLANLWSCGQEEAAFQRGINRTVEWLKREMTAPQGYFYASQDADNFTSAEEKEPEEGAFYVWEYQQLEQELTPAELQELTEVFTFTPEGNFEGKNVLQRRQGGQLSDSIESILDKLFMKRYGSSRDSLETFEPARNNQAAKTNNWPGRIPPVTDTKMIVAWNSLMISGLARAYGVFQEPLYWELATNAAEFIVNKQWINGRLYRLNYEGKVSVLAQSEDYAFLIKALLDLQSAIPQETKWLEKAMAVQEEFDELFWSVEMGGYYNNAADNSGDLLVRERSYIDNATPSANGIALGNLVRLARLTDNLDYLHQAEQVLQAFAQILTQSPRACPSLFSALDWYYFGSLVRTNQEILAKVIPQYFPTTVYRLDEKLPHNVIGLVCQGLSCLEPAKTKDQLLRQMREISQG